MSSQRAADSGPLYFHAADGHISGNVAPTRGGSQGDSGGEPRAESREPSRGAESAEPRAPRGEGGRVAWETGRREEGSIGETENRGDGEAATKSSRPLAAISPQRPASGDWIREGLASSISL